MLHDVSPAIDDTTRRLFIRISIPQSLKACSPGSSERPVSVNRYSIRMGFSGMLCGDGSMGLKSGRCNIALAVHGAELRLGDGNGGIDYLVVRSRAVVLTD